MGIGEFYVSKHALRRLKERWPLAKSMARRELIQYLASSIESAREKNLLVKAPGGTYMPFKLGDEEGFVVTREDCIVTVVPKEWAPEVTSFLENLNGSI